MRKIVLTFEVEKEAGTIRESGKTTTYSPYMILRCIETKQKIILTGDALRHYRVYEHNRQEDEIDVYSK